MIIQPHICEPGHETHDDQYTTSSDFIACLGRLVRKCTSADIDQNDKTIPLAIRMSAQNPFRRNSLYEGLVRHVYSPYLHQQYLDHASAIIPATDGAFWLVFPYSDGLSTEEHDDNPEPWRQCVWYFPPGAKSFEDACSVGPQNDHWIVSEPREFVEFEDEEKPVPTASFEFLYRSHPCGASYTNVRLPISVTNDVLSEMHIAPESATAIELQILKRKLTHHTPSQDGVFYVDALVCCGGYFWAPDPLEQDEVRFCPSPTMRLYVPSPTWMKGYSYAGAEKKEATFSFSSTMHLTETILIPGYTNPKIQSYAVFRNGWESIPIGCSVQPVIRASSNYDDEILVAGGLFAEKTFCKENPGDRSWITRGADWQINEFPLRKYNLTVALTRIDHQEFTENLVVTTRSYFRLYAYPTNRVRHKTTHGFALNSFSNEGLKPMEMKEYGWIDRNNTPLMYPVIAQTTRLCGICQPEFYSRDPPPDVPIAKFPETGPILSFNHLVHEYTPKVIKEGPATDQDVVYNVPLASCHFGRTNPSDGKGITFAPLNISGTHGLSEGAVPVPIRSGYHSGCIVMVGGAETKFSNVCGGVQFTGTKKDGYAISKKNNIRDREGIRYLTNPKYAFEDVVNLPTFSKLFVGAAKNPLEYRLGPDTLRYDCLHSQAVRLGDTEFFVLPTSVLKYEYPNSSVFTNATLLRARQALNPGSDELKKMSSAIERHIAVHSDLYVSEVIGMPVVHEGPEKFSEETPYWYGHASTMRGSLGSIESDTSDTYWMYYLGNGKDSAEYFEIELVSSAKSLLPNDGKKDNTRYNAGNPKMMYGPDLPGPRAWQSPILSDEEEEEGK